MHQGPGSGVGIARELLAEWDAQNETFAGAVTGGPRGASDGGAGTADGSDGGAGIGCASTLDDAARGGVGPGR